MDTCIDFTTATEKDILTFLRESDDHVVIGIESKDKKDTFSYRCGKRSQIVSNNFKTIFNNGRNYYNVYQNMYVCPMDKGTLQNTNYCIFKFEYLRPHTDKIAQIYNVKKYKLSDFYGNKLI